MNKCWSFCNWRSVQTFHRIIHVQWLHAYFCPGGFRRDGGTGGTELGSGDTPPERWGKGGAVRGGRLVTGVMVLGGVSLLRGATGGAAGSVAEWEVGAECCMPLVRAVLCSTGGWEVRVGSEEGGMTGGRLWRIPEALPERCRCQLPWSGGGIGGRELKLIGAEPGIGTGGRLGKSIREERLNKAQA